MAMTPDIYSPWKKTDAAWLGDEVGHVSVYSEYKALQCEDAIVVLRSYLNTPRINNVLVFDASLYLRIDGKWRYEMGLQGVYPSWEAFFNYCREQGHS
jgi:hypothetical protein